ncbi:hypothetical protein Nepgr_030739 [Nepenthes gracilis]|uniref:Secreted protein n=1 Tax=Nepenthes gracilis TaxID=150966 RepID=A0AAD3TH67_NEPGR|nr:hypothetical protein Nepgr_030739 [Nepenthes gracilis]
MLGGGMAMLPQPTLVTAAILVCSVSNSDIGHEGLTAGTSLAFSSGDDPFHDPHGLPSDLEPSFSSHDLIRQGL